METLLTPTESLAFQSFLASVDNSHPQNDWAAYSSQYNPSSMNRDDEDIVLDSLGPPAPENDSLTKATKDLMSLDAVGWSDTSMMQPMHQQQQQQQQIMYDHQMQQHHPQQQTQPLLTQPLHRQHSYSSVHEPFPFLNSKGSSMPFQQQQFPHPHPHQQQPLNINHMNQNSTPTTMFAFPQQQQQQPLMSAPQQPSISSNGATGKRPIRSNSVRIPPSTNPPPPPARQRRSSQSPRPSQGSAKPALLSPSQKKANHIQSEQKRRANIRRGYEALCETVPALREAIREEEEEVKRAAAVAAAGSTNGGSKGKGSSKKRATKKKDGDEGGSGSGAKDSKIDGRAGPRSENVVLSKTIDYINDLLFERTALLARLQKARSTLPPGHPGLTPLSPDPAWEREWKGGQGKFGGEEEEEEESDGEGEEDEGPPVNGAKGKQRKGGQ